MTIDMVGTATPTHEPGPRPFIGGRRGWPEHIAVYLFAIVPFVALVAAAPLAWGWGLSWVDIGLAVFWYTATCPGVTVGFHRYFTHGSFKAKRPLRIALAVAGRSHRGHGGELLAAGDPQHG